MKTGRNGRPIVANVDRLHDLMDAAGLAAVVVRGGQNVTYLGGVAFHGTLSRHLDLAASRRGVVVVWPRHAEPVFVLEVTAAGAAASRYARYVRRRVRFHSDDTALATRLLRNSTRIRREGRSGLPSRPARNHSRAAVLRSLPLEVLGTEPGGRRTTRSGEGPGHPRRAG